MLVNVANQYKMEWTIANTDFWEAFFLLRAVLGHSLMTSKTAKWRSCLLLNSGNLAGDVGARILSKALLINQKLSVIHWDRNGTTAQGFADIASALQKWVL